MITVKFMVVAQSVVRDGDNNSLSAFNILEGIASNGFPLLIQQLAVAVVLQRDPASDEANHTGHFEIRLGDQVLASTDMAVRFEDKRHTRQILRVAGLLVPTAGVLEARYTVGDVSSSYTVSIESMTPAQLQLLGGQSTS